MMNKKQLLLFLLAPFALMIIMAATTYTYWQMEADSIQSKNSIPHIDKLAERISREEGIDNKEKLLSFTKGVRNILVKYKEANIESTRLFRSLLEIIFSLALFWAIIVVSFYIKLNKTKNLTNSSSGTGNP